MTLAQMRTEVRRALFEMTADFFTDAEIDAWLNEAAKLMVKIAKPMDTVYSFNPSVIGATTVYQHEYPMPEGCDEIFEVFLENGDNNLYPLPLKRFKALHGSVGNAAGVPQWCYTRALAFETLRRTTSGVDTAAISGVAESAQEPRIILGLYPKPQSTTPTIFVHYYSRHFTMDADAEVPIVPVEYRRGIIHYATAMGMIKDSANADSDWHMTKFKDYSSQFKEDMIFKGQDLSFPTMIDDEDEEWNPSTSVGYLT